MKRYLATFTAGAFFPSLVVIAGGAHIAAASSPSTPFLVVQQDEDVVDPITLPLPPQPRTDDRLASASPELPEPPLVSSPSKRTPQLTTTLTPAPAHIAANVDQGVHLMNQALVKLPGATATMTQAVAEHGLSAFAYDVPEVKKQTDDIGRLIGGSLRSFAEALRDDMVKTARESGIGRKP